MKKVRTLVVDDSAVMRQVLSAILARSGSIEVLAAVADPIFAMQRMRIEWPDVIVLDVEMPRMDGITFLRKIMAERPTPVVICSTLTTRGAETTMQALSAGAVAIVPKPRIGAREYLQVSAAQLVDTVRTAASARVANIPSERALAAARMADGGARPSSESPLAATTDRVVAIGTSTGGTQALELVLSALPRDAPGIVVVQHMPEKFTAAFARRLDGICQIRVKEAETGDRVLTGQALIAPGGRHMQVVRSGAQYRVEIDDGPPVNRHRPSVDVLFRSVARHVGANALGIIMTGMGRDGAYGLSQLKEAGARTVAQDEASCVVFGMPQEAIKLGAASVVAGLGDIARHIMAFATLQGSTHE